VLAHTECGSAMNVIYYCPTCETNVKGAGVRLEAHDESWVADTTE